MIKEPQKVIVKINDRQVTTVSVYPTNHMTGRGLLPNVIQKLHFQGITDKAELVGSSHPHDKDNPTDDIILYYETKK